MSTHPLKLPFPQQSIHLGARYRAAHLFDQDTFDALKAALATERPLLLTGEPGVGKTQIALAAAVVMRRAFIPYTITGEATAKDLLWEFDAISRLADAQIGRGDRTVPDLAASAYIRPGPIWFAFAWDEANARRKPGCGYQPPPQPTGCIPANGTVLLLDEIDKADPELPNGLLECLGDGCFPVPFQTEAVAASEPPPLVIITSNGERALPAPFLRRCILHRMRLGRSETEIRTRLIDCGLAQFGEVIIRRLDPAEDPYTVAATCILADRKNEDEPHAGLAEYIDLLRAVVDLPPTEQVEFIGKIRRFVCKADADQARTDADQARSL